MTRILLVETAAPARVRRRAEEILRTSVHPDPVITILCCEDPDAIRYFREIPGAEVIALAQKNRRAILDGLQHKNFDIAYTFWTGEKRYRGMKLAALRLSARRTLVEAGDGNLFPLTWKAFIRHSIFRMRHPLPSDHYAFVPQHKDGETAGYYYPGEKILMIQSAEPEHVLAGLKRLAEAPLFRNPRYTLFCRNRPDVLRHFTGHPMLHEVRTHTETKNAWQHLRLLRSSRFDAAVLFLTGNPGYWRVKLFAFLVGARRKLIFNENNDCFFFSIRAWLCLMAHRISERSRPGIEPHWNSWIRAALLTATKLALLPLRFAWLLLVWLRLRYSGSTIMGSES